VFKKWLRWVLWLVIALMVCVFTLRAVGYLSDEAPISDIQLHPLPQVADEDNAYLLLAFIDDENFSFGEHQTTTQNLWESWNSEIARKLLAQNEEYLSLTEKASNKKAFKSTFPAPHQLPSYSALGFLSRLPLIKARVLIEDKQYQRAAKYLIIGLRFNDLIQHDANATLVAFLVGSTYQSIYLNQIIEFASYEDVPDEAFVSLLTQLRRLDDISEDGFKFVWSGEKRYAESILNDFFDQSIGERFATIGFALTHSEMFGLADVSHLIQNVISVTIPEYAYQRGKIFNHGLQRWALTQRHSEFNCFDKPAYSSEVNNPPSWLTIFKPNGLGEVTFLADDIQVLDVYFNRRCANNFHVNATKLVIAIKRYENANSKNIESLSQLLPDFINQLPVDPFSGKGIVFNSKKRYLYSYGANFNDDGGASSSIYSKDCHRRADCFNNPTVAIDSRE